MKKRVIVVLLLGFIAPFIFPASLQSHQTISFTTHCWLTGTGGGDGGFYQCDDAGCTWISDEDPLGEADQECDQPEQMF